MAYLAGLKSGDSLNNDRIGLNSGQWMRLFYADNWPQSFYRGGPWKSVTSKTAIARIEHFIQTDGQE